MKVSVEATNANIVANDKPIGANENDFEAVLLDGCLGFSLSVGNAALIIIQSVSRIDSGIGYGVVAVLAALVTAFVLRAGQWNTDAVQRSAPRKMLIACHTVSYIAAVASMLLCFHVASATLAALGMVATTFLYGRFLAALARKALMLVIDVVFMYAGIMLLLVSQVPFPYSAAAIAVSVGITVVIVLLFVGKTYDFGEMVSAADSKDRSIKVKGNNHTLFLLGFMFSAALMAFSFDVPKDLVVVSLGAAVGLAGILSLLTRQVDERFYKESLKKSMAFTTALFLLPMPFFLDEGKLVLLSVYVCLTSLNVIVLLNAVVETTRFNMISPMWLLGQEGSVFFVGIVIGCLLFSSMPFVVPLFSDPRGPLSAVCIVAVVVCAWVQIRVNYQIYPFEPVLEESVDDETSAQIEQEGRRKVLWHQKIEVACDRYRLSPREREILRILLKGRDAKYIMDTFYISQSTAKTHIYNIYRKFGIHSRQELLDFVEDMDVADHGLDEMPEGSGC